MDIVLKNGDNSANFVLIDAEDLLFKWIRNDHINRIKNLNHECTNIPLYIIIYLGKTSGLVVEKGLKPFQEMYIYSLFTV